MENTYIPTTDAPVTVIDYSVDDTGLVTLGQAPQGESSPGAGDAAVLDWSGSGTTDPDSVSRLGPPTGVRSFGGFRAADLADPVDPQDAATRQSVADAISAVTPGAYTVATLPATAGEGVLAFATDGRKTGEAAGAGTGAPVYYSAGQWRVYGDDGEVLA